ncbi:MAG: MFS transporter [Alicyclobacillaceae bacterium]|nr:MFS transporter [Alicyclobacillaceae bacterium]
MEALRAEQRVSDSYAFRIAVIFFFTWGFVFLDRSALSLLIPVMLKDMPLNNTQIGLVNMWQSIGYAIAAPVVGYLSDRIGYRKRVIILAVLLTSVFSGLTAIANSYPVLLVLRFLVGATEGGIMPIAVTMIRASASPSRFGRYVGIVYAGAAVIASTLGPTIVAQLSALTDWRMTYLCVSIPSFILTFIIWKLTKETPREAASAASGTVATSWSSVGELFRYRNFIVCVFMCIVFMGGLWLYLSFGPLYLTQLGHMTEQRMGFVWSAFGLSAIFWQLLLPTISDWIGRRKPLIIALCVLSAVTPLAMYAYPTGIVSVLAIILLGGIIVSVTSFYASIIPNESLPPRLAATASAVILGVGELVGAFVVGVSGRLADSYGLSIVMAIAAGIFVVAAIIAIALIETHVRRTRTASAQTEPVSG